MTRDDEPLQDWVRRLAEPRTSPADESRRLISLLLLGSVAGAIAIVAIITWLVGAPLVLAVFVAVFFLCLDSIAIAIVWYSSQRR